MTLSRLVLIQPDAAGRIFLDARKRVGRDEKTELLVSFDHDEIEYARERAVVIAAFLDIPLDDQTERAS